MGFCVRPGRKRLGLLLEQPARMPRRTHSRGRVGTPSELGNDDGCVRTSLRQTVRSSGNIHPASPECEAYRRAVKAPLRFDTTFVGGLLSASGVPYRKTEQTSLRTYVRNLRLSVEESTSFALRPRNDAPRPVAPMKTEQLRDAFALAARFAAVIYCR